MAQQFHYWIVLSLIIQSLFLICSVVESAPVLDSLIKRAPPSTCANRFDTVFVFGDSYSAIQGEKGNGATWSLFESPDAVTNNPIIRDGTTSGGANWNEYITGCFEGLPQDCPAHLYNVAYNGATVDRNLVESWRPQVEDFITQAQQWQNDIKPQVQYQKALGAVWFGINDVGRSLETSNADITNLLNQVLDQYFTQLDHLYEGGLREFMIINVPPFDRTPKFSSNATLLKPRIDSFNTLLQQRTNDFHTKHSDVVVFQIDAHERFTYYLDNAGQFGIEDTTHYCDEDGKVQPPSEGASCLSLEKYFYQDELHPTYPIHKAFADDITNILNSQQYCI
ncbi:GDSL lipase/esterase [Phascolomyces articulosus]|uniref:GDSL lipase/esterase n=1 Tax=Phascolomyces articulosus TaxID=60185 RepID=A0AAD5JXA7_9FUNG|nr:GDSL lipase/esterase [Phascolomyces articulosus]